MTENGGGVSPDLIALIPDQSKENVIFTENERIFAFHQGMLYEAKILKIELRPKPNATRLGEMIPFYFIHYQGWKDRWDEWVGDDRILKFTDKNKQFQQTLKLERQKRKRGPKGNKNQSSSSSSSSSSKKRKLDKLSLTQMDFPLILQKKILEDYEQIVQQKCIVTLPSKPSISTILNAFLDDRKPEEDKGKSIRSVVDGIQLYFERAIGTILLYRFERQQYQQIFESSDNSIDPFKMCQVYGVIHLLRLLSKLPQLIQEVDMEQEARDTILSFISELLKFLEKNVNTYFSTSMYSAASPTYCQSFDK